MPPRALYARAESKDALFLAVYEHGMQRVLASHDVFRDPGPWDGATADELVRLAVTAVADIFVTHRALLRAVVLISGAHPEVSSRGADYRGQLESLFCGVLAPLGAGSSHPAPDAARSFAFGVVFSTLVFATAYGPPVSATDVDELTRVIARYLIG